MNTGSLLRTYGIATALVLLTRVALAQPLPPNVAAPPAIALPSLEELQATRERPLFAPNRRPDATAAPVESEAKPIEESAALPFELTGIVLGPQLAVAILQNRASKETVQLRQGEALDDWTIEEIAARNILVRSDSRRVRLQLFDDKPDAAAPPVVPAAVPSTPLFIPPRTVPLPPGARGPGKPAPGGLRRRDPSGRTQGQPIR